MLSQMKRANVNPIVAVTCAVTRAFNLRIGDFREMPHRNQHVIRRNDRLYYCRSDKKGRIRTLPPLTLENEDRYGGVVVSPRVSSSTTSR